MAGTNSPVEITKISSMGMEKDCGVYIAIVANHFFVGQQAGFQFLLVYFHIGIATAAVLSCNPYYVTTGDRYGNFVSQPWAIQLVLIPLRRKRFRFLDSTIRFVHRHVHVGDCCFVINVWHFKVDLNLNRLAKDVFSHTTCVRRTYRPQFIQCVNKNPRPPSGCFTVHAAQNLVHRFSSIKFQENEPLQEVIWPGLRRYILPNVQPYHGGYCESGTEYLDE